MTSVEHKYWHICGTLTTGNAMICCRQYNIIKVEDIPVYQMLSQHSVSIYESSGLFYLITSIVYILYLLSTYRWFPFCGPHMYITLGKYEHSVSLNNDVYGLCTHVLEMVMKSPYSGHLFFCKTMWVATTQILYFPSQVINYKCSINFNHSRVSTTTWLY